MRNIGGKIRLSRNKKNITQRELAEFLNVSRSAISNWEVGRHYPDLDCIVRLCDFLGLSLDELLRKDIKIIEDNKNENSIKKGDLKFKILISMRNK